VEAPVLAAHLQVSARPRQRHSVRIAIAASPARRRAALIRKGSSTVTLPPSITHVKLPPVATTRGQAPTTTSRRGPSGAPRTPTTTPMDRSMANA
jgi:hypothetical protein